MRQVVRYLALLLACLAGCAAPAQHYFPLDTQGRPTAVAPVAWASTLLYTDGAHLCGAVLVAPDTALTARHCVAEGIKFVGGVLLHPNGTGYAAVRAVIAADADLAFLQLAPATARPAQVGEVLPDMTGHVLGYGCSTGRRLEARPVKHLARIATGDPTDPLLDVWHGRACKGDSGGGVFDLDGNLVGISVRIGDTDADEELLFTVPAELVRPLLQQAP